ncbi:extracellular solute-binding protein [Hydrogenophaga taeniospiralis]|uniref:ABC transporter substrate-binding protein n=1 Tax=Hydrogenophaga taeniospiralis TaxID=65656 RepID=UPI001CFB68FA|nr:extracellular solute-binding protein [Hydrogenophaga taeniospiralis]MCB4363365.1 extracellular solute-binding protein [Hydrogenophaga taeniospiralis]
MQTAATQENSLENVAREVWRGIKILSSAFLLTMTLGSAAHAELKRFDGTKVRVLTFDGPSILEPLKRRAKEFEKLTGATVVVKSVPYADLYGKVKTDWQLNQGEIDAALIMPQWMPDFAIPGYLEELSGRMYQDSGLKSNDIAPFFSAVSQKYGSKTYLMALDGDFHLLYYRSDILQKIGKQPPQTWDEYLEIARLTHNQDYGDGKISGSCIAKRKGGQSYWIITTIAASYLQSKGAQEGVFFNRGDMSPLVNNEGFTRALEIYKESTNYGPPNEVQMDIGDTRALFIKGGCALTVDWGDIGPLAADAKKSKVVDKVGVQILPGSRKIVDRSTGKLISCEQDKCPFAKDGVNHAPFAAAGGWSAGISSHADKNVKIAAYALFSYMSQPAQSNVDVTKGETGFNPYRFSQFMDLEPWIKSGMSMKATKAYLGAIQDSLYSQNMVLDLRIPSNNIYQQVVLDGALAKYLEGSADAKSTIKSIEDGWNRLTDEIGRASQLKAYLKSIGSK